MLYKPCLLLGQMLLKREQMCEIQGYIHTSVLVCVGSSPSLTRIEGFVPFITKWLIDFWYNCHSPHSPGPLHLHSWTHSDELWPKDRTFDNTQIRKRDDQCNNPTIQCTESLRYNACLNTSIHYLSVKLWKYCSPCVFTKHDQ